MCYVVAAVCIVRCSHAAVLLVMFKILLIAKLRIYFNLTKKGAAHKATLMVFEYCVKMRCRLQNGEA